MQIDPKTSSGIQNNVKDHKLTQQDYKNTHCKTVMLQD